MASGHETTVGCACATKCEKCEKELGQCVRTTLKEFENVSAVSNRTERGDVVISQDNHTLYLLRYIGAAALSRTHCSRCGLHGIVTVFSSVFAPGS